MNTSKVKKKKRKIRSKNRVVLELERGYFGAGTTIEGA